MQRVEATMGYEPGYEIPFANFTQLYTPYLTHVSYADVQAKDTERFYNINRDDDNNHNIFQKPYVGTGIQPTVQTRIGLYMFAPDVSAEYNALLGVEFMRNRYYHFNIANEILPGFYRKVAPFYNVLEYGVEYFKTGDETFLKQAAQGDQNIEEELRKLFYHESTIPGVVRNNTNFIDEDLEWKKKKNETTNKVLVGWGQLHHLIL